MLKTFDDGSDMDEPTIPSFQGLRTPLYGAIAALKVLLNACHSHRIPLKAEKACISVNGPLSLH
jgi:hypothetical protein